MLINRRQLKRKFVKAINEALGFDDNIENEEVITWNDPERAKKIRDYKSDGREDYVIQNLDNLDPYNMSHREQIRYVNAMAEKLASEFEEKSKKRKELKAAREAEAMDAYIEMLKQDKVSTSRTRRSMTLDQIVDMHFNKKSASELYDITDIEHDKTVIDPEFSVTKTADFNQYG